MGSGHPLATKCQKFRRRSGEKFGKVKVYPKTSNALVSKLAFLNYTTKSSAIIYELEKLIKL